MRGHFERIFFRGVMFDGVAQELRFLRACHASLDFSKSWELKPRAGPWLFNWDG